MIRPPSEYELTKVNLSTRVVKINNLFFDGAIIFFVPKVADKGVDLTSLQCSLVQITDRGMWGKEEETFTVDASSFDNRKYREFNFTTDAEYSLKIIPPPELRMGILEIYFDPNTNLSMAEINNPAVGAVDLSAITAAIAAGSAAEVAATQSLQAQLGRKVGKIIESFYPATVWTNAPASHIAIAPDPNNLAVVLLNTSNKPVYWDLFIDINAKTQTPQYDNVMPPGGSIRLKEEESSAGVLLYTLPGNGTGGGTANSTASVSINIER